MKLGKKILNERGIIIVSILLGALLMLTGCGKADVSIKTYDKESEEDVKQISKVEENATGEKNEIENKTEEKNEIENNTEEKNEVSNTTEDKKKTSTPEAFSDNDLVVNNQFRLGGSAKAVEHYYGDQITSVRTTYEDATGRNLVIMSCENIGLEVQNSIDENNADGEMIRITLNNDSKLKTARGIKIGDSKEKILNAYKSESILENKSDWIVVGYPGDDSVYETNKGKIYFSIENGKVTRILLAYGVAE